MVISGTTKNPVSNDHNNEDIDIKSGVDVNNEVAMEKATEEVVAEKLVRRKEEKRVRVLPPLLTSLNRNGRRGFSLESVRTQGRLQIMLVPNHFSEVVRTSEYGDRVSMELLESGDR
ncbi:hypothetical protein AgCh_012041 [Apium graveolens]